MHRHSAVVPYTYLTSNTNHAPALSSEATVTNADLSSCLPPEETQIWRYCPGDV